MGLGDILGTVGRVALPIIGGIYGGPVGAAAGAAVAGSIWKTKKPVAMPGGAPIALPGGFAPTAPIGPGTWIPPFLGGASYPGEPVFEAAERARLQKGLVGSTGFIGSGASGGWGGRRYKRMNPMNIKAARRAIRRIKSARKLMRSIESQLPRRAAVAKGGKRCR